MGIFLICLVRVFSNIYSSGWVVQSGTLQVGLGCTVQYSSGWITSSETAAAASEAEDHITGNYTVEDTNSSQKRDAENTVLNTAKLHQLFSQHAIVQKESPYNSGLE